MSVSALTARDIQRESRTPPRDPPQLLYLFWGVSVPITALVGYLAWLDAGALLRNMALVTTWIFLAALVDLIPVLYSDQLRLTLSVPLLLAAGMVLHPAEVGAIAYLGSWDTRELRRQITFVHAVYNRSQVALSCVAASAVFHTLGGEVHQFPAVIPLALLSLITDALVNGLATAAMLVFTVPLRKVASDVLADLPMEFLLTYLAFAFIALILAVTTADLGAWGLTVSIIPIAFARQMLEHRRKGALARAQVTRKNGLLRELSERIAEERRDERARIAMSLHDEVLSALYRVHLLAEVLRQDLHHGRLLGLEEDMPLLRDAAHRASASARDLIRDLRKAPVGVEGLAGTLRLLVRDLSSDFDGRITAELAETTGSAWTQLLAYQVAKEALENAVMHSGAKRIQIRVREEGDFIRLAIEDDGSGFDVAEVDTERHFGLQIMRERAYLAGGDLIIETRPGGGTRIGARFPTDAESPRPRDQDLGA